jgi:dTDP-4-dehydrorhamnose reductase
MRILVLGASGMLGSAMFRVLNEQKKIDVYGTTRSNDIKKFYRKKIAERIISNIDIENYDSLISVFRMVNPEVVINCIGLIKQVLDAKDPLLTIPVNSLLPHRLARLCELAGARLIHISTDCVFDGKRGGYTEDDRPNATDLYGLSKYLGEVHYSNSITLRTSIIGHELNSANGLIGWFLQQQDKCRGYTHAIFSGLPTVELARLVRDYVIPNPELQGLYHVASTPISKFDLLNLVAEIYGKKIDIAPDSSLVIDRSLKADCFNKTTGYSVPQWPELIKTMYSYYIS